MIMMLSVGNVNAQTTVVNTTKIAADVKGYKGPVPLEDVLQFPCRASYFIYGKDRQGNEEIE